MDSFIDENRSIFVVFDKIGWPILVKKLEFLFF
jgi:hypothetical protein